MNTQSNTRSLSFRSHWLNFIKISFRPLIKILIKNKVEFKSFNNICKELYIEEAEKFIENTSNDNRGKISSIAYQTGLDRREVSKALKEQTNFITATDTNRSRESSILDHWNSDILFCDNNRKPLALKRSGSGLSFETLVQRFGKNISHGPILNELIDAGCVEIIKDKVHYITNKYTPSALADETKSSIASLSINRLASTLEHNLSHQNDLWFQRNLYSIRIDKNQMKAFRDEVSQLLDHILIEKITPKFDEIESNHQTNKRNEQAEPVGLGLFFFQQQNTEEQT